MNDPETIEPEQADVVEALGSGAATGAGRRLRRIDTHMSRVFLDRWRAYKLKRARNHPFLDLSSLEARRASCEAELAVNRVLAPDLYERISPLARDETGAVRLNGPGEVVDWVVVMRRLPSGALLSEKAAKGELTLALIAETAQEIARAHLRAPATYEHGQAISYAAVIEGLRETEREGAEALGLSPGSEFLFEGLEHEFSRVAPLIKARWSAGWVRRCHGDLHLRNICVLDGKPVLFDALEFSVELATTDVLYDFAFLLMDLRARGLDAHANVAMNRYWDATAQPESGLDLLPFFMALRAAVRMAVAMEAEDLAEADRYRRLGLELLRRREPRLVAIGGLSGTGKSAVAAALAPALPGVCGARLLRTDVIRKRLEGAAPTDRLPPERYAPERRTAVYKALEAIAAEVLAARVSAVADATFQEAEARLEIAALGGERFQGIWLRAPLSARLERVAGRSGDASDATAAVAAAQTDAFAAEPQWTVADASAPLAAVVDAVRAMLSEARPEPSRTAKAV